MVQLLRLPLELQQHPWKLRRLARLVRCHRRRLCADLELGVVPTALAAVSRCPPHCRSIRSKESLQHLRPERVPKFSVACQVRHGLGLLQRLKRWDQVVPLRLEEMTRGLQEASLFDEVCCHDVFFHC